MPAAGETEHICVAADGATLAYRRWHAPAPNGAAPLLLIHGAASNLTRWSEFLAETRLKTGRDILRVDLRGHGASGFRGPTGLEIWCDDLAALLRAEGIARAVLVGHCMGANVAVMFAARHPRQAAGLVLVEPMLCAALVGRMRHLRRLAPLLRLAIGGLRLLNRLGIHRRALATLDLQALDREFRARLGAPGGGAVLARRYSSIRDDLRIMPTAGYLQDLVETVRPLPLAALAVPVLALISTGRTFVDPECTRAILAGVPNAAIDLLACQHWIPTEAPREMRVAIEDWLAGAAPNR